MNITPGTLRAALLLLAMAGVFTLIGSMFGAVGAATALACAIIVGFWSFWSSGPAAVAATGARELTVEKDRNLLDMVSSLSARAGVPMPRVFEIDEKQPNAMAVGANPSCASLVLTKGIRRLLTKDELAALIGHEIGHIKSRDTLAAAIGATFLDAILTLSLLFAFLGLATRREGGGLFLILAILTPVTAIILLLAASRSREYAADKYGAELTGDPRAMAAALRKLAAAPAILNKAALHSPAMASLWFVDPLAGTWLSHLFSTHPDISKRIARLERLQPRKTT